MAMTNHCMFFVKRKKRYCRMTVKAGRSFCGEHEETISENNDSQRIECPLDPSHTCYRSRLSQHLKVCNTKQLLNRQPVYIVKGINGGTECMQDTPKHKPLSELEPTLVNSVIEKIHKAYDQLIAFSEIILQHQVLRDVINDPMCGRSAKKHLLQTASLLGHLERSDLMRDDTCFIEFGAGRGKLTYWLAKAMEDKDNSCILLVDRSSHKHKRDNKLKNEKCSCIIKRIRADITDLDLSQVKEIKDMTHKVGIAKHLCGAATDLTIRCLVRTKENDSKKSINGLIIAFCCHHRCEYKSYTGKRYLEESGFTCDEFPILCSIASWATCGFPPGREPNQLKNSQDDKKTNAQTLEANEREYIGRKVKTLLNWGRLQFLKDRGFQANLIYYISMDVSLENMCIIATCDNSS